MKVNPANLIKVFVLLVFFTMVFLQRPTPASAQYSCLPEGAASNDPSACCSGNTQYACFTDPNTGDYICGWQCTAPTNPTPTSSEPPPPSCESGQVFAKVYVDSNRNRLYDGGEPLLNNITITASDPGSGYYVQDTGVAGWGAGTVGFGVCASYNITVTLPGLPSGYTLYSSYTEVPFGSATKTYNGTSVVTILVGANSNGGVYYGLVANQPPSVSSISINPNPAFANNSTLETISMTVQDGDGGGDVTSAYTLINFLNSDGSAQPAQNQRGYIGWSNENFPWWCGVSDCSSTNFTNIQKINCSSGGGSAGLYPAYGSEHIYQLVDCTTSVSGSVRTVNFYVRFASSYTSPVNNTLSGWTKDSIGVGWGWGYLSSFTLARPPLVTNVTINSPTVAANGTSQYTITITSTDGNGAADIRNQNVFINFQGPNTTIYRGLLGWSDNNFPWWGGSGSLKPGSFQNPCGGGGQGGIYNGYGPQYINIVPGGCTTSVSGNTRTTTFTVTFDPAFNLDGPASGNTLSGFSSDSLGLFDGWREFGQFGIASVPPLVTNATISNSSVVANGSNQYVFTMTATDGNGGADIKNQYVFINFDGPNTNVYRGLIGWSADNFPWWSGSGNLKPGSFQSSCSGGGQAGVYNGYGQQYINIVVNGCSTSVSGITRTSTLTVTFDPSFNTDGPVSGNTISGFASDLVYLYDGWREFGQFGLANSPPSATGATIATPPVNANGIATYTITSTASDPNGASDIDSERVAINGADGSPWRGVVAWSRDASNFSWWGGTGNLKPGSTKICTNSSSGAAEGRAAIYGVAGFGSEYINLVSCTTSTLGITRTVNYVVSFNTNFRTNGPQTGNRLWEYTSDVAGLVDGWRPYATFDLGIPNLTVSNVVLRHSFGSVANCSNGVVVPSGGGVPNGTVLEVCVTFANNGNTSTGSTYRIDNYINQATKPADGTAGYQSYVIGPTNPSGAATLQMGSIVVNSAVCTNNCRAAVFIDRDNTISESSEADNFATSGLYNVVPAIQLTGTVVVDALFNNCASGATPYAGATTPSITMYNGGTAVGSGTVSGGNYTVSAISGNPYSASISNLPANYTVKRINYESGGWTTTGLSGFSYSPVNLTANRTLSWCLNNGQPWIQTGDGDVRFPNLVDPVPSGGSAGAIGLPADGLPAFFSSNSNAVFGAGSAPGFIIDNEFSYNDEPRTKQGLFSYTFFINRAKIKGLATTNVPGCPATGDCTITAGTVFPASTVNTPYLVNGDLYITGYTHRPGTHVLLLVSGTAAIQGQIKVPAGSANLFILATKGNINVNSSVGTTPAAAACATHNPIQLGDYSCANIEGIYSTEQSFRILSSASCPSTPDRQLTLAGNIVTNALKPFATNGTGKFVNNRTLCNQDATLPSFIMLSRYDFVPQLTDFYKVPSIRWKEISP